MFVPGWIRFQDAARAFEIRGGEVEIAIDQILSLGNLLPIAGSGPRLDLWGRSPPFPVPFGMSPTSTELCRWLGIVAACWDRLGLSLYTMSIFRIG